jgi:hypothetical protein
VSAEPPPPSANLTPDPVQLIEDVTKARK